MRGRYPRKYLEDGSLNPAWRTHHKSKPLYARNVFIAWDGEGVNRPDGGHDYQLLMVMWRKGGGWEHRVLRAEGERLYTEEIVAFIRQVLRECPKGIHVAFSASYDVTHILRDVPWEQVKNALQPTDRVAGRWAGVRIKVRPRKMLRLTWDKKTSWTLWDVFGFFQGAFVTAVEQWLGEDYPDLPLIREGKAQRGGEELFADVEQYTLAELRALIQIMERLNNSLQRVGLKLSRWDGPGAAAAAAFRKHLPAKWFERAREPLHQLPELYEAVRHAYFGGRIEFLQYGYHRGDVYQYDINSAYPAAMVNLPDLAQGRWVHTTHFMAGYEVAVYRVWWDMGQTVIGPFPFRLPRGAVVFPEWGEGWYWAPEVEVVLRQLERVRGKRPTRYNWAGGRCTIVEGWVFIPDTDDRPFNWVRDIYEQRKAALKRAKAGDREAMGEQLALKLVINSLYGKTAQKVGYMPRVHVVHDWVTDDDRLVIDRERIPPYYNLVMAGYITSHCRAKVLEAALQRPRDVVAIATDGLLTTRPLRLEIPSEKVLGEWDETHYTQAQLVLVQSGVYYIKQGGKWKERSRGFPAAVGSGMTDEERQRAIEERVSTILAAWRREEAMLTLPTHRFIGLRGAAAGSRPSPRWDKRGQFEPYPREMQLWVPFNSVKRRAKEKKNPAEGLVSTWPRRIWDDNALSYPYEAIPLYRDIVFEEIRGIIAYEESEL